MGVSRVTLSLFLAISVPAMLAQSPRPSLAGHWIQESPRPEVAGPGPTCASECVITQDVTKLTMAFAPGDDPHVIVKLDGSPTSTVLRMGAYTSERTLTAAWEGSALVIVTKTNGSLWGTNRLSLKDGRLVISATGKGRGGDGTTFIYRRASK